MVMRIYVAESYQLGDILIVAESKEEAKEYLENEQINYMSLHTLNSYCKYNQIMYPSIIGRINEL